METFSIKKINLTFSKTITLPWRYVSVKSMNYILSGQKTPSPRHLIIYHKVILCVYH